MSWDIRYLSTGEDLEIENYAKEVEWSEEHFLNDDLTFMILKIKEGKEEIYEGRPFGLSIPCGKFRNWAFDHWNQYTHINIIEDGFYVSHHLDSLFEFLDEMKLDVN